MHTKTVVHLSTGDHVGIDVDYQPGGTYIAVFHIDHGNQRLELHAEDPEVLYELSVRISALASKLAAQQKTQLSAKTGLAACRSALDGAA